MRISVISCWAAFERSCTSAYELSPCTRVAASTPRPGEPADRPGRAPITSSMRYLVEPGRTSPATRLTAMRTKPGGQERHRGVGRGPRRRAGGPAVAPASRTARRVGTAGWRHVRLASLMHSTAGPGRARGRAEAQPRVRARRAAWGIRRRSASRAARSFPMMRARSSTRPQRRQATMRRSSRCRNFRPHWQRTRRATKCRVCRWRTIFITPLPYAKRIPGRDAVENNGLTIGLSGIAAGQRCPEAGAGPDWPVSCFSRDSCTSSTTLAFWPPT